MQIKYIIDSVEWFDKANGNTYASTRVIIRLREKQ